MNDSSTTRKPIELTRWHTTARMDAEGRAEFIRTKGRTTRHTTAEAAFRALREDGKLDPTLLEGSLTGDGNDSNDDSGAAKGEFTWLRF